MRKPGMYSSGCKLRFEALEERTVLNGTAIVGHSGSTLVIEGDNAANTLVVQQTGGNLNTGATIKVTGAATKLLNVDTGKTGTAFTFTNVFAFNFFLEGGNDVLTVTNVALPGAVAISTGDGNDTLIVANVFAGGQGSEGGQFFVDLGNGNNTATFANLLVQGNIEIVAGNGKDVVTLANVFAGTSTESQNSIRVDLGTGKGNTLTVSNSRAFFGSFADEGTNGQITGANNHFTFQLIQGFALRIGDLKFTTI